MLPALHVLSMLTIPLCCQLTTLPSTCYEPDNGVLLLDLSISLNTE